MPHRPSRPSRRVPHAFVAVVGTVFSLSCGGGSPPAPAATATPPTLDPSEMPADGAVGSGDHIMPPGSAEGGRAATVESDDVRIRRWADETLRGLSLREKVGQLMMPWVLGDFAPDGSDSHEKMLGNIVDQGVGGVIVSVGSPVEVAAKLNDFQRHARIPLLVGADLETGAGFRLRGAVHMPGLIELGGATDFPSMMALGATGDVELAYEMGRVTAVEARAVGIHMPFAPVLDVNNNPENPIINVRSLGEDPERVSVLGAAVVRGIQDHGGISTGKHFPGHGDTETDSHLALPIINHTAQRMDSIELRPFQAAIDAGIGAVMTAHISVPALTGGRGPSTLSPKVMTDLLRGRMGFKGLLVTDAMDMSAISRQHSAEEAAVLAVEAGADIILMPPFPERAINGIVAAVESGRISEARIDASVRHILETKAMMRLDLARTVPIEDIPGSVGIPAHTDIARHIAERSITVLENGGDLLPLRGTRTARVLSVSYRRTSDVLAGRYFDRRLRDTYPRLTTENIDRDAGAEVLARLAGQVRRQDLVIVSTYVTAASFSGSVGLPDGLTQFVQKLVESKVPHVVVSFGNPYVIGAFPGVRSFMLAWSGSEASQTAAAAALFGDFDITGRTPTRIPPLYPVGSGLTIPAKASSDGR